ncbi:hypothetical protein BK129_05625 [Paenibacillus amylolyticus]|nr:hypothetical protein BK129_05625 [Paenibacillus amylolyticus]
MSFRSTTGLVGIGLPPLPGTVGVVGVVGLVGVVGVVGVTGGVGVVDPPPLLPLPGLLPLFPLPLPGLLPFPSPGSGVPFRSVLRPSVT